MDEVVHDNYSMVDYTGLRRLLLQEIVELNVGDSLNIIIPPSTPPRTSIERAKIVLETFFDKESLSWMTRTSTNTDKEKSEDASDVSNESNSTCSTVHSIASTEPDGENEHLLDVMDDDSIAEIDIPASKPEGRTQRLKPLGNIRLCVMKIDWMKSDLFEEGKLELKDISLQF